MSERETYPSPRALADMREEQMELRTHVAYPGRVQSYDPATQTADIVPLIRQQVPQPDGVHTMEDIPIMSSVPVIFPRVGGWFLAFNLAPGDTVQLLCNTSAIGHWRMGNGDVTDPGDLRRQHIAHAVAIPGLYTRGRKLNNAPSGDDAMVIGADANGGTRLTFKADGSLVVTHGADVVMRIDTDGTVHLGGAAGDFVALAGRVDAELAALRAAVEAAVIVPNDGGAALKAAMLTWSPTSVAATKTKAT